MKQFGKFVIGLVIFNINELIIFGMLIVMNLMFFILFIIILFVILILIYIGMSIGFVVKFVGIVVLWMMLLIFFGYFVIGGKILGVVM